jgi:hypothetical protein
MKSSVQRVPAQRVSSVAIMVGAFLLSGRATAIMIVGICLMNLLATALIHRARRISFNVTMVDASLLAGDVIAMMTATMAATNELVLILLPLCFRSPTVPRACSNAVIDTDAFIRSGYVTDLQTVRMVVMR